MLYVLRNGDLTDVSPYDEGTNKNDYISIDDPFFMLDSKYQIAKNWKAALNILIGKPSKEKN
jgi:hypothetical protein